MTDPFAFASVDDDALFGAAFDVDDGEQGQLAATVADNEQVVSRQDNASLVATFGEVAATYLRPLQHFCAELCRGAVASSRIAPLLPPLGTVIASARGMGLEHLAEQFSSLQGYLEAIQQHGAPVVDGTSREAVLQVSGSLAQLLPGAFGDCVTGDPLDGVMLRSLLQQLPAVTAHSLEQFFGAGFTSAEMLAGADPEELTAITGLAAKLCELSVRHAADYLAEREQRLCLTTSAEWLPVLEPRLAELERLQRAIEQGRGDTGEERRRQRQERQRAVLQMELLLAEMGRVALLEELQRLRLERRLERLREFVADLRRPSREELVQRLATGQSLQHLDLRDQHLEGIQLPSADLAGADLTGANLAGAGLQGARFIHACLRESFLQGADLGDTQLRHAHLEGADLAFARLPGSDLSRAHLEATRLEGADLEGACLRRVRAAGAKLAKAHLVGADLRGADLSDVDIGGADLRGADLGGALVVGANFRGADLRGAQLAGCDLTTAWIEGAWLEGAVGWGDEASTPAATETAPEKLFAPAAAQQSATAALEAVAEVMGGLGGAEQLSSEPELAPPAPASPVESVTTEKPAESYVLIVRKPELGALLPPGRWAWAVAAAGALVLMVAVGLLRQGTATPEDGDTTQRTGTHLAGPAAVAEGSEPPPRIDTVLAPVKGVKAAPGKQVKTAPARPVRVTPVKTIKAGPAKKTRAAPVATVRKTTPASTRATPKIAPQAAVPPVVPATPQTAPEALSVTFVDAKLEACVRVALGRTKGRLRAVDVAGLTELNCSTPEAGEADVTRLEGIEALVALVSLDLSFNQVTDIRPLAGLDRLEQLNLRANRIADIRPVAALPGACEIDLWQNPIDDIAPLLMRGKR